MCKGHENQITSQPTTEVKEKKDKRTKENPEDDAFFVPVPKQYLAMESDILGSSAASTTYQLCDLGQVT